MYLSGALDRITILYRWRSVPFCFTLFFDTYDHIIPPVGRGIVDRAAPFVSCFHKEGEVLGDSLIVQASQTRIQ